MERITYSIENALYSGADAGDACGNKDGNENRDQGVFDGGDPLLSFSKRKTSFGIGGPAL